MNFKKKYTVVDNHTGEKYEVVADELEYLHNNKQPEPEPIDYTKEVNRLYKKAFTNDKEDKPKINEVKKFSKLLNNK